VIRNPSLIRKRPYVAGKGVYAPVRGCFLALKGVSFKRLGACQSNWKALFEGPSRSCFGFLLISMRPRVLAEVQELARKHAPSAIVAELARLSEKAKNARIAAERAAL
jgi:hypothetical protein